MERLKSLKSIHQIPIIAILEPFSDSIQIQYFRNQLNMDHAISNPNGKIWLFWNKDVDCRILENEEQLITCEFNHVMNPNQFIVTFVYAKCKDHLRRPLWDSMLQQSATSLPWCTLGDFNVITDPQEKLGGVTYNMKKSLEFISIIEACGLQDLGFCGQRYTWSNLRGIMFRIWKRLDRGMVNDKWLEMMPQTTITHLPSVGSDHCPLLLEMTDQNQQHTKYFKFLNCWTEQPSFLDTVSNCWNRTMEGNPMWCFHQKMKRLAATLSTWSRLQFGDIYAKVKEYEDKTRHAEEELISSNSEENRTKLHAINAEYIKYLKLEESMLKQKTQLHWFKEGDVNSKYFHALIRGRRRKLYIHKIQNEDDNWVQGEENIAKAACEHFQAIFTGEETQIQEHTLQCIPRMVTDEHNRNLKAIPTMEELRTVVFLMNPNSAAGPDGMNGKHGFFHSTRGLKQGDPLSPALFIIGAEVLSRLMNNLHQHPQYHGFLMAKKGPQINHLSFADDIIIFSSGRSHTLKLIMETLHTYEHASGQLINRDKSNFMVPSNAFNSTVRRIKKVTGFKQKNSPITYLGCPLYIGRQRIIYYSELIAKVVARIAGWQAKLISYGGRVTLIKHVIQALPIHLLSASSPPATTIKQIQSITANFFWGWKNERRKYHWSSWKNLSYPYEEGGIGVRLISDVAKSFQYKQWWIFRTKNSLWSEFLKAKYCQRSNPITKKWHTGQSLIWKHLMKNKHNVEPHIQWQIQSGSCLFWWDNWLGVGPLANFRSASSRQNNTKVFSFMINGQWNAELVSQKAPPQFVPSILASNINYQPHKLDQASWKPNSSGEFSCSSAWELIRDKRSKTRINSQTWHKHIPFKCSFLLWRALRGKLPTNEKLISFGEAPAQCYCCHRAGLDTIDHIFVSGNFARKVWSVFSDSLGISKEYTPLRNLIMRWWSSNYSNEVHKLILQATPIFICWNLWKNRCAIKYGGKQSNITRVIYSVFKDNFNLLSTTYSYISWPNRWKELVLLVEKCTNEVNVSTVYWRKPSAHMVKLNTDGSALHNPGKIGGGGLLRNNQGDLLFAFSTPFGEGTNNQSEILAAIFGLTWCLQLGYTKVILEVDSELVIRWIKHLAQPPWTVRTQLQQLQDISHQFQVFKCNHTYREANFTADVLSKHSHKCTTPQIYLNKQELPKEARPYFELDKLEMANFRRRRLKRIKKPP
ncbi:uncharacterized protein LOC129871761 [Solanum dulcamara]|uniref:uncharacterized protein LOC129871761 n=2 Tax=Solanum dulcamara TaxID=45834 RepID=UPI0024864656|nr:uncharacterized protein LOC129871761 [Solanum dulcamara]